MGDLRIEEQYQDDLSRKVAKMLQLKRNGSLLIFGGRFWRFGLNIASQTSAKTPIVYADHNRESLNEAEEEEGGEEGEENTSILTTECEPADYEQMGNLGKYDGVLMKEVLEKVSDLDALFASLYRILKMSSKAVILVRFEPKFPVPERVRESWTSNTPDLEALKSMASQHDFEFDHQAVKYQVAISKEDWSQALRDRCLPYTDDLTDEEIEQCLKNESKDPLVFEDELHLIGLIKEFS